MAARSLASKSASRLPPRPAMRCSISCRSFSSAARFSASALSFSFAVPVMPRKLTVEKPRSRSALSARSLTLLWHITRRYRSDLSLEACCQVRSPSSESASALSASSVTFRPAVPKNTASAPSAPPSGTSTVSHGARVARSASFFVRSLSISPRRRVSLLIVSAAVRAFSSLSALKNAARETPCRLRNMPFFSGAKRSSEASAVRYARDASCALISALSSGLAKPDFSASSLPSILEISTHSMSCMALSSASRSLSMPRRRRCFIATIAICRSQPLPRSTAPHAQGLRAPRSASFRIPCAPW